MTVPYIFATANGNIPLSELDANFANVSNYSNTAGSVVNNIQANITSVGTLVSLSVAGNVTGNYFIGNGSQLTGLAATYGNSNVVANLAALGSNPVSTSGNITGNIGTFTTHNGTTFSASGNVTGGNIRTGGVVTATGNITGNYFIGNGSQLTGLAASYGNANVVANLAALGSNPVSTTGNVSAGYFLGNGSQLTGLAASYGNANVVANLAALGSNPVSTSGNITGNVGTFTTHNGTTFSASGNVTGGNILFGSGIVSGTGNISGNVVTTTTVNATTISASGNITGGNLSVGTGTVRVGNIVNNNANGIGNIGSSSLYFNTVFAVATSAQYADLAENYLADAPYVSGTVVSIGGDAEVTQSSVDADSTVIGVVSTNPAYHMNTGLVGGHVIAVALTGRVPCRVTGSVKRGSALVSNGDGTARAEESPQAGTIIGKALTAFYGATGVIEVVIGRF